jgi:uncharacterized membrane protein
MQRGVDWLYAELPRLVERGVLSPEAAEGLRRHYGPSHPAGAPVHWGQVLLASFGALLVGGGIILILAHNWDEIGRPLRAAIALGVLLVAQALTLYAVVRRAQSVAWREATSGLLVAAVGAAISLVGQTYHVGGSFEGLMRAWLWLVVPIPYLTGSSLAAIGFWALLVVRLFDLPWRGAAPDVWPLAFAGVPFVVARLRSKPDSWATALVALTSMVSVFILGSVVASFASWSGLWAVFDVSYLAALIGAASWPPDAEASEMWRRRALVPAWLALIVVGTILTFDDEWRQVVIVDRQLRNANVVITLIVSALCAAYAAVLAVRLARAGRIATAVASTAAVLVVVMHLLSMFGFQQAGWAAFNVWLLTLGILTIVEGLRTLSLRTANLGLAALAALVIARFFDTDLSFLVRGLAFVSFGLGCFALNFWLMRRMRRVVP